MIDENSSQDPPQEFDQRRTYADSVNLRYPGTSAPNGNAAPYIEHHTAPVISQERAYSQTTIRNKVTLHTISLGGGDKSCHCI